jgi:hypothetical protein
MANRILDHVYSLKPTLRGAPPFEVIAVAIGMFRIAHHMNQSFMNEELADAIAELLPDQREFWLRVEATCKANWINGMLHLMTPDEEAMGNG